MKQFKTLTVWCAVVMLVVSTGISAQFPFSNKQNQTKVVRESELYNIDKQLGVNGSYIFIYDKEQCDSVDGELAGKFKAFDTLDSTLVIEGFYDKGVRTGVWTWYDHGHKIVVGNYVGGNPEGQWIFYNKKSHGEVMVSCALKDGKLDGVVTKYALKNGSLANDFYLEESYEQGRPQEVRLFNPEKVACLVARFEGDTMHYIETSTEILINSQLCERKESACYIRPEGSTFADLEALVASMGTKDPKELLGSLNGNYRKESYVVVDTNSTLVTSVSGKYNDNEQEGEWLTQYFDQGVNMIQRYEAGVLMSVEYAKMKNGKPYSGKLTVVESEYSSVISIKKGKRNGKTTVTSDNGDVEIIIYKNGSPVDGKK